MAQMEEREFRVRAYECDAYGHLNNTTYLRYVTEVEAQAGGMVAAALRPRLVDIRYLAPADYDDRVVVIADDVARTEHGVVRRYELSDPTSAVEFATAEVFWAEDEEIPAQLSGIEVVPPPPAPPERVYREQRHVGWRDVDARMEVGPGVLSAYAEDCGVALCDDFGWSMARCTEAGFAMVLHRHQVRLGRAAGLGDELALSSYASDRTRISAIRHYLIDTPSGDVVAHFRSHYVWTDVVTMRPIRIPAEFLADFESNFA